MKPSNRAIHGAIIALAGLAMILVVHRSPGPRGQDGVGSLPGARPVVDAERYPSLQAAIDALPAEGGLLRLPPGVFEIAEPLVVSRGDVAIVGAGPSTHIRNTNASGKSAIVLRHPSGQESREAELWRIHLSGFRLTGNPASGHGIEARRINELFVHGVSVSEHGGDGIHLHFCYEDPRICDSLITYNKGTGLHLNGCHDIVVSSNQFEENRDALRCLDGFNLTMTGNNLDDHLGDGVVIENTYGSVVSGSANAIAHNAAGGFDLRDAHGCTVSGNTFTIMGRNALVIGAQSGRITVSGNNFSNSFIGEGKTRRGADDPAAGGLVLEGSSDIGIAGNVFAGVRPKALAVEGKPSRRVLFAGNLLTDTTSDHAKLEAAVVETNLLSVDTAPAEPATQPARR
jgi:hypothetical protein